MKHLAELTSKYEVPKAKGKHQYEFQELGAQLEKYWGKRVWVLFHMVGFTENRIRQAARACWKQKKVGPKYYGYLFRVIQNSQVR